MAWEPISYDSSFATFICAEEWLVPMAVHSVCLALMAKKASRGRKLEILTGGDLAFVWLEMRVHKFTGRKDVVSIVKGMGRRENHTHSCT
jgi:hypothetical protein